MLLKVNGVIKSVHRLTFNTMAFSSSPTITARSCALVIRYCNYVIYLPIPLPKDGVHLNWIPVNSPAHRSCVDAPLLELFVFCLAALFKCRTDL